MSVTYFMFPQKMYAPEIGAYNTYSIAVYGFLHEPPIRIVRDVSPDGELVFCMTQAFNRHKLSPLHLLNAIQDMLG